MKMRDVMVIAVTAALTAALALALSPAVRGANADEPSAPGEPRLEVQGMVLSLAEPSLEVEGVVLSLTVDPDTCKPGERPVLTLTGVNTQHHAVDFRAVIVMTTTVPASPVARMLPMPTKADVLRPSNIPRKRQALLLVHITLQPVRPTVLQS